MAFFPAHHFFKVTIANIFTIESFYLRSLLFILALFIGTKDFIKTDVTSFPTSEIVGVTFAITIDRDLVIILFLFNYFILFLFSFFLLLNFLLLFLLNLFLLFLFDIFFLFLLDFLLLFLLDFLLLFLLDFLL